MIGFTIVPLEDPIRKREAILPVTLSTSASVQIQKNDLENLKRSNGTLDDIAFADDELKKKSLEQLNNNNL
jgi:hypothetical protein